MWVYEKLDIDLAGSHSITRLDSLASTSRTALAIRKAEYTGWTYIYILYSSIAQIHEHLPEIDFLQSCNQ
jgi:hypothetical protein